MKDLVGAEVGMEAAAEGVGVLGAEVGLDAAQGEVHHREAAGGGVALFRLLPPQPHPAGSRGETPWALPTADRRHPFPRKCPGCPPQGAMAEQAPALTSSKQTPTPPPRD